MMDDSHGGEQALTVNKDTVVLSGAQKKAGLDDNKLLAKIEGSKIIGPGGHQYIELEKKLGEGGQGSVYLGKFVSGITRQVAVKISKKDPVSRKALQREARIASTLSHPGIAGVEDFWFGEEQDFLRMNFIPGDDCREIVKKHNEIGILVPPFVACFIPWAVCEALEYAHSPQNDDGGVKIPVIHRDLTPDNIRIGYNGHPILVDFGTGLLMTEVKRKSGEIVGKLGELAPEIIQESGLIDHRVDIYGLGMCMYYIIASGRNPLREGISRSDTIFTALDKFKANLQRGLPPLETLVKGIDSKCSEIVKMATAPDPKDRYSSATKLRDALSGYLYHPPGDGRPTRNGLGVYLRLFDFLYNRVRTTLQITGEGAEAVPEILQGIKVSEELREMADFPLLFLSGEREYREKTFDVKLDGVDGGQYLIKPNGAIEFRKSD